MTNEERREKLSEIFGQHAEFFEDWFCPATDFEEADEAVAKRIGKPLAKVTVENVLDYIREHRPEVWPDFLKCVDIAVDACKHGRLWTSYNPLRSLMDRKDLCLLESFAMYYALCIALGLEEKK